MLLNILSTSNNLVIKARLRNPLVYTHGNEKSSTTFFTGKDRTASVASNGSHSFSSEMLRFTQN